MAFRNKTYLLITCLVLQLGIAKAQNLDFLDSLKTPELIDSLLIDHNISNYSFRVFTNFKNQSLHFNHDDNFTHYVPNNRTGLGIGLASKKIVVDLAISLKFNEENPTQRFGFNVGFKQKGYYLEYFFQWYKGFNAQFNNAENNYFRNDLTSLSNGINFLYLLNNKNYPVGALHSVITLKDKTSFSIGIGAFALLIDQKGDSAVFSSINNTNSEFYEINDLFGIGGGALVGLGGFFAIGKNMYSSLGVNFGIGLMHKSFESTAQNISSNPLLYQANGSAALGYVHEKYYLSLTIGLDFYSSELLSNTTELINVSKAKLAFGYKFFKKKDR